MRGTHPVWDLPFRDVEHGRARSLTAGVPRPARHELRTAAEDTVVYMVTTPKSLRTDRVSNAMMELMPDGKAAVEWNEKQKDKVPK